MNNLRKGYMLRGMVVLDKAQIEGANENELEEVSILIPSEKIKEMYEEMKFIEGIEEEFQGVNINV